MQTKKIIVLTALFVVPGLAIFWLNSGTHNFKALPFFGPTEVVDTIIEGKSVRDTIQYTIPPFSFTNQNGDKVTNATVAGKIYVANFFFTRCGTVCPKMNAQMRRVEYQTKHLGEEMMILSHTIDPRHDSLPVLRDYAEKYYADTTRWQFLRASSDYTFDMAANGYFISAAADAKAQGGFLHSEMMLLIDRDGHMRGTYDGTDSKEVDRLIEEIKVLKKEEAIQDKERNARSSS